MHPPARTIPSHHENYTHEHEKQQKTTLKCDWGRTVTLLGKHSYAIGDVLLRYWGFVNALIRNNPSSSPKREKKVPYSKMSKELTSHELHFIIFLRMSMLSA